MTGEKTGGKSGRGSKGRAFAAWVAVLLVLGGIVGATSLDGGNEDLAQTEAGGADGGFAATRAGSGAAMSAAGDGDALGGVAGGSGSVDVVGAQTPEELGGERISLTNGDVIKEAHVEIDLGEGDLDAAQEKAVAAVRSAGGFVESSRLSDGSATMTFRVPAADFDDVLARMRDLGEVKGEDVTGEDVSAEVVDLEARLRHWQAQETAFLALMERTTSISETIEIRRELGTIQQQIEQIDARRRFLDDRTAFSTLTVSMTALAGAAPPGEGDSTLSEAWDQAWDAALSVVGGTLIVLGALVPLSVIVGIPGLVVWSLLRRRRTGAGGAAPAPAA